MDVTLLSAVEQLALMREGRLSSSELIEESIRRIERLNPALNAFVEFAPARLRAEAAKSGSGPLGGLPITV